MGTISGQCTVTDLTLKYDHGVQAMEGTKAALTAVHLVKAETEELAREIELVALLPGDFSTEMAVGDTVVVTISKGALPQGAKRPPKLDGIQAAREQAGYGVAAVVLVPKDAEAPSNPKLAESAKEPAKKSY